jgi:phage shock protein PspC (stress-responsive transcriptional regulator)
MNRRLYRSSSDRVIAGVCGGLADLWGIDPSLVRIGWFLLIILTGGILLLLYIVMAIVVPAGPPAPYDQWGSAAPGAGPTWGSTPAASPTQSTPAAGGPWPGWGTAGETAGLAAPPAETAAEPWAIPDAAPATTAPATTAPPPPATQPAPAWVPPPPPPGGWAQPRRGPGMGVVLFGVILVIVGVAFLINQLVPSVDMAILWPVAAIILGAVLLVAAFIPGGGRE